jgi:tetratricopeptide (TPR) repeat protein
MILQTVLEKHIMDPKNPELCYDLAKEYDKLENGAMAVSLYLKAADLSEDNELQYKCMIGIGRAYDRQRDRGFTVQGAFQDAVALCPSRPEAHYLLCKHYEDVSKWKDCLMHANLALSMDPFTEENCELGYPGPVYLQYYQALASWYIAGQQNGKELLFDLKYKETLPRKLKEKVSKMLDNIFYPDIIPYVSSDLNRYKFPFEGIDGIGKNHSKHFQDMFVLSVNKGKRNGSYLEIGSGDPYVHNNTALLEEKYGWKGISIDNSEALCYKFKENRSGTVICADATKIDYEQLFKMHSVDNKIDYLQIDCDDFSIAVLEQIPFDRYKFGVVTFEHDSYRLGTDKKFHAKRVLEKAGYVCAVPNVCFNHGYPYEDWYYHPDVVDMPQEMKSKKEVNFIWDYFMRPIEEE